MWRSSKRILYSAPLVIAAAFRAVSAGDQPKGPAAHAAPFLDVTMYGASGSNVTARASVKAGQEIVELDKASDFKAGQGIKIEHAGPKCSVSGLPCPAGPTVTATVSGSRGSSSYVYQIAVLDDAGGVGSASQPFVLSQAPAALGARSYNVIHWTPVPSAAGYAIYRDGKLFAIVSGLTPEGYYDPPRGPAFTSSFRDMGLPPVPTPFPDIPTEPPAGPLADSLISRVISVDGAQRVRLRDLPGTTNASALATHDDSVAMQAAFDAAPSGSTVHFPAGHYLFTQPGFSIRKSITIQGAGNHYSVLQDNLVANSFAPLKPPLPCGFLSPVDSNVEISNLDLEGLSAFGSSMTRRKKGVCASGAFERLYVHDVTARRISGEVLYAEDTAAGDVILTGNTIENSAKNALNTNSGALHNSIFQNNTVRNVSGAAILAVSQDATISQNQITGGNLPSGSDVINVATTRFFTVASNEISGVNLSLAATSLIHVGFYQSKLNGSGLVVANSLHDNTTANGSGGGAIFVDDLPGPVLIANNLIERLDSCCQGEIPAIALAHATDRVLITGNTIRTMAQEGVGVRIEKSVPQQNRITMGVNEIITEKPFSWLILPGGQSESDFDQLKQMSGKWPKPVARP